MPVKIVVVGGGLMGASVAAHLAEAGAQVTLLTKGRIAEGASAATFAWLNAQMKLPEPYLAMNMNGMAAHRRYADKHSAAPWYHPIGGIEISFGEAGAERQLRNFQTMRDHGYNGLWLTAEQLLEREPDIDPLALKNVQISHFPDEGYVDAVPLVTQLCLDARFSGAEIVQGAEVVGFDRTGDRLTAARCADGRSFEGDVFVNAAGPHAGKIAMSAGGSLPMINTVGLQFFTGPAPVSLNHVLHCPQLSLRPDGGGRLCMHDNGVDQNINARDYVVGLDNSTPADHGFTLDNAEPMLGQLRSLYPALSGIEFEAIRVGVRPIPGDRMPVVGFLDGCENLYCTVMHSGVTQSVWVGELATREILEGSDESDLKTFRPGRFLN